MKTFRKLLWLSALISQLSALAVFGQVPRLTNDQQVAATFALQGDITPAQITANQNDYNPTGLSTAAVLRLSTDASRNITGIQGGADGRILIVANVGSFPIVLVNASSSSTAAYRFAFAADVTLAAGNAVPLIYDSTSSRWRLSAAVDLSGTYQPLDATLTALAGVTTAANKLIYATGSDAFSTTDLTAFGRAQLGISSLTSTALILGGGSGAITASDITYASPTLTVPASFAIAGAGSVSVTPGGSGVARIGANSAAPSQVSGFSWQLNGYGEVDNIADASYIRFRRTNGTAGSPTAILSGDSMMLLDGGGYKATAYNNSAFSISATANENWTDTANGTRLDFLTTANGATAKSTRLSIGNYGKLTQTLANGLLAAWGTTGAAFSQNAATFTDSSSSGTVTSAVANSYAVPIFAASSSTTFTNVAALYLAGDPTAGSNVTLTNSYALWNVGKTRVDAGIYFGGTTPGSITGSSGAITIAAAGTDQNVVLAASGAAPILGQFNTTGTSSTGIGVNGFHLVGANSGAIGFSVDGFASTPLFVGRRANGTGASPAVLVADDNLFQISARGHTGSAYTGTRASITVRADENWSTTANGTRIEFLVVPNTTSSGITPFSIRNYGGVSISASASLPAWGVTGASLSVAAVTKTDSSSSGTVATVTGSSFAVPAFAAASTTTFTNAANVYIAGVPTAGTNVTLTNSWALWAVGQSRFDVGGNGKITINTGTTANDFAELQFTNSTVFGTSSAYVRAVRTASSGSPTQLEFGTMISGTIATRMTLTHYGQMTLVPTGVSISAWGTAGILSSRAGATITDSSTAISGTAASAVFHSFAAPTLAATNATVTTTVAANVYIAGDVVAGTNQTLTGTYGLWNVGKSRLDGNVLLGGTLTKPGGATLIVTNTALTDGAGAATATFTNAPSAGNPTKWIGINDNGTTRYVPAF